MRKLRYGFIGAGGIAGTHMEELTKRDDVELVAVADVSPDALADISARFNVASTFEDHRKMLREANLDAVSVCTPNRFHMRHTIDALRAGCDVLCEKPLAMNAREGARMVAAANELGRKLAIGFQYRYNPRTAFLKRAADEGQLGRVVYARVQALRRRGIPNWGVFGRRELQGGGPLIDIGVHALEMAHFVMGSPTPVSAIGDVFSYLGNRRSDRVESVWKGWDWKHHDVEDLAVGRIRFEDGAVLTLEAAWAAHVEKNLWTFELLGEEGGASWDPPKIFRDEAGHMVDKSPAWLPDPRSDGMFKRKMFNFVEHCLYDAPLLAPGADGLVVQKMIDGIYRSAERGGKEVRI